VLDMLDSNPDYLQANLYILPPSDASVSDEDSGDEDDVAPDNLTRRQLQAEAEATAWTGKERVRIGNPDDDFDDSAIPSASEPSSDAGGSAAVREQHNMDEVSSMPTVTGRKKLKLEKPVRQWVKADMPGSCRPPDTISSNRYVSTDLSPTALFEQFFDNELIQLLEENTDKYAMQKGRHSFHTSESELRLFLAILFNSGYVPLPRRRLYWEPSPDVQNTAISSAMTRNRFEELMTNIHVSDNNNLAPNDRMAKVRPLFTALNQKFVKYFPQQQHLSVDESMVPYYGRHSAKQFIRGKPIRFGYKVWSINTPLGYCVQLDPYQGAGVTNPELGLGGSVVVQLASILPTASYVLYFDNFFTSLRLLQHLSSSSIKATGTVRVNRIENCPITSVDKLKKMARGASDHRLDNSSKILVARWHDNSVVTLASNCHGMEPAGSAQRWSSAEKRRVEITQPYLIGQYNKYMGGVDRMDQNIATYRISIRSRKWWWPLFAYLLDVAMQNAWIIYRQTEGARLRPLDQLEFRRDICAVYYKRYSLERASVGRPVGRPKHLDSRAPAEIRTDRTDHFIESIPTQRRCAVCGVKVKKQCTKCNVGLHLDACFATFHRI